MLKLKNIIETLQQEIKEEQGPCWDGYQQIGMKDQNGKQVPNCVPIKESEKSKDKDEKPIKYKAQRITPDQAQELDINDDGKFTKDDLRMFFKILRKLRKKNK